MMASKRVTHIRNGVRNGCLAKNALKFIYLPMRIPARLNNSGFPEGSAVLKIGERSVTGILAGRLSMYFFFFLLVNGLDRCRDRSV